MRLNNRLRNVVQAALGGMTCCRPIRRGARRPPRRCSARATPPPCPPSSRRWRRRPCPRIRTLLREARAAIILFNPQAAEADRIGAARALAEIADNDALALLRQTLNAAPAGPLREVLEQSIASVERVQRVREVGQTVWFGVSLGSVLLLAAIGLAITFGVMGVINMAHGEMVMIGAYATFVVQEVFRARFPHLLDWSLPLAIPVAFLVAGAIGVAIERGIIRFLYGRPLETLLATFGLSLILQQAVRTWFGPTNREVTAPSWMSGSFEFVGLQITYGGSGSSSSRSPCSRCCSSC